VTGDKPLLLATFQAQRAQRDVCSDKVGMGAHGWRRRTRGALKVFGGRSISEACRGLAPCAAVADALRARQAAAAALCRASAEDACPVLSHQSFQDLEAALVNERQVEGDVRPDSNRIDQFDTEKPLACTPAVLHCDPPRP
jgi:hypothetical protein